MARTVVNLLAVTAVTLLSLDRLAFAQQQKTQVAPSTSWVPEFTSGILVSDVYDDNIYATPTDKVPDQIRLINPFANLRFRGDKGEVNLGGNAAIGRYATHTNENYDDYSLYGNGRYNFSPMLSMTAGTGYDHLHEPRSSPDARPGVTPTTYDVTRAFGAALMKLDQNTVRIGGTFDRFNYDNVAQVGGGTINNEDRDRDMVTIGTRIGHSISNTSEIFGLFTYDDRNYRLPVDDYGISRRNYRTRSQT